MIAKNIKGKSFKGCVSYVMNESCELLEAEGVLAMSKQDMIRSFAMQRSGREEIKQPVGHIPLSFAPEDKERMTDEFMVQLAKEYMQEMGIGNTQYIIVRHHNTDNEHLHIVYNRIDNNLKLISVNNDYKRNIKACKKLKDKYNLTYGEGKDRVKREKLNSPDKVKYYIYDAIKEILPTCKNLADLRYGLQNVGIETEYKYKRTTFKTEGISFRYNNISFKGSQVDRKFSYGNLKKEIEKNLEEMKWRGREEYLRELAEEKAKQETEETAFGVSQLKIDEAKVSQKAKWEAEERAGNETEAKQHPQVQKKPKKPSIGGVALTPQQWQTLKEGGFVFLENMKAKDGSGLFSAYVFLNDEKNKAFASKENPDNFVKYGQYEMCIRDKMLIEAGYIVKATVKWWVGGYAHPYLWKENKSDMEYKQSWGDPKLPKTQKEEQNEKPSVIQKKNRGQKR